MSRFEDRGAPDTQNGNRQKAVASEHTKDSLNTGKCTLMFSTIPDPRGHF